MPGSADVGCDVERFDRQSLAAQQMQLVKTRDDRRGVKLQRRPEARDVLSSVAISPIDPSPLFLSPMRAGDPRFRSPALVDIERRLLLGVLNRT